MAISAGLDLSPFAGNDMFDEISNYKSQLSSMFF